MKTTIQPKPKPKGIRFTSEAVTLRYHAPLQRCKVQQSRKAYNRKASKRVDY